MNKALELSEVIQSLREDLTEAAKEGDGKKIRFNVSSITVELQTVMEKKAGAEAGAKFKFWVLDASAKATAGYREAATHKIVLNLQPVHGDTDDPNRTDNNQVQLSDKAGTGEAE